MTKATISTTYPVDQYPYRIKGWHKFQHFKDRKPPWIKLYRELLDDVEWFSLDGKSAKTLIMLWLVASENGGNLPETKELSWRLRIPETELTSIFVGLNHWLEPGEYEDICNWASRYVPKELKTKILKREKHKCAKCGSTQNLEIDHIVPVSQGGNGDESNLQALCRSCNREKRVRSHNYADATQTYDNAPEKRSLETETETETETESERKKERAPSAQSQNGYAFQGKVIKLTQADFEKWQKAYSEIIDLKASLTAIDDYYTENPPKGGQWFHRVSNWLAKDSAKLKADNRKLRRGDDWD